MIGMVVLWLLVCHYESYCIALLVTAVHGCVTVDRVPQLVQ